MSITKTIFGSVFNAVPGLGNLRIIVPQGSYDCFDWSGTSTPGRAFNGMGVGSGFPERFRLEASYRQYREADSGGPWTMEVVVPSRGGWERVSSRLAINAEANAVDRAKGTASGRTSWPGSSAQYRFYPISDTSISDSSPEVVRGACSKDWRNFGLGSYQGKLVWFFCSDS